MVSTSNPPPAISGAAEPEPPPSLPGAALWSDSDAPSRPLPAAALAGLVATPADRAMPTIGHIGRYALKYRLGEGGLGTVYAAHDPLLSRVIAVKTLNVEVKENEREAFNAQFLNEARAAAGLSHPHIVTVFDAGISDDRAYIAMELLKGRDLRQLRQEGWRATPAQAALIVRRVADALAFAHSKGVIHRDVKPANIFMVGRTQPRVLDFGIARIVHRQDGRDALARAGSPYYMAPEQVRGEPADRRADVFSLGVVLYELLADERPFRGDSLKDITEAVLSHEPAPAWKIDRTVPKALAAIAARAMSKDPEQRFRSARSLARELRQWLDANPVGPEPAEPVAAVPRRRPLVWASGLAAAGAIGAAAWLALPLAAPAGATRATLSGTPRLPAALAAVAPHPTVATAPPAPIDAMTPAPMAATTARPAPSDIAAAAMSPVEVAAPAPIGAAGATPDAVRVAAAIAASGPALPAAPAGAAPATSLPAAPAGTAPATSLPAVPAGAAPATARPAAPALAREAVRTAAPTAVAGRSAKAVDTTVAAPAPARESARDRRLREARETREREAREIEARVAAAHPTPAAPATGTVRIAISPWGQVEIDGAASGAAPPLTELTLAEGRHRIVVRNGDYAPYVASIVVSAGQTVSLRYKFGS